MLQLVQRMSKVEGASQGVWCAQAGQSPEGEQGQPLNPRISMPVVLSTFPSNEPVTCLPTVLTAGW